MSLTTKIQWVDSTVNPTMGCDGCELWDSHRRSCYAGILHVRFGGRSKGYAPRFEEVTTFPGRMAAAARWSDLIDAPRPDKPWLDGRPRLIFISDMSDALSKAVPFTYLRDEVIGHVDSEKGRRHRWLWLTKRPARMAALSRWLESEGLDWPTNLWAGTSITAQANVGRIQHLAQVGGANTSRFLSVEPQVEPITLGPRLLDVDWVIHGGESGRSARPFDLAWADDLIAQCADHGTAYFLKQLGANPVANGQRLDLKDGHGGDPDQWPDRLKLRQVPDGIRHGDAANDRP